ncbi:MAG: 1-deoxy-D-xylulose-5-phosphate reductoisomerase [Malacoplasma sp.]|nr:1-deoxy-D-xylulose-5-phosphate reductoisomerase [Malacoplasma sp.]
MNKPQNKRLKVLVFGITGTIGDLAIDVILKQNYELVGFSFFKNIEKAKTIKNQFKKAFLFSKIYNCINNVSSYYELLIKSQPDIVLNAVVGFAGLEISLLCLNNNFNLALANKESLVNAGWLINDLLKEKKLVLYPVDSEHSAIFDLLKNNNKKIEEIIITCSGGPFFNKPKQELQNVKFKDAIKHPNWNMGYKISIDSATLMNKFFEIIEAYYLFNTDKIFTYQHSQSIVHGLVKFSDNSIFANMSNPDMRLAINQALSGFESNSKIINSLEFDNLNLSFKKIDPNLYRPIYWAYQFLKTKNLTIPIILNAANDTAIELFKEDKIRFLQILEIIEDCVNNFLNEKINNLEDVYQLNLKTKNYVLKNFGF